MTTTMYEARRERFAVFFTPAGYFFLVFAALAGVAADKAGIVTYAIAGTTCLAAVILSAREEDMPETVTRLAKQGGIALSATVGLLKVQDAVRAAFALG